MTQPIPNLSSLFKLEYPQSVGVYGTYDEAQRVVDFLADARFPVENLCIVGTDLKSMERVLGRRSWGTVIGAGVQSGLTTGVMITLVFWILQPATDFLVLMAAALAIGVFVGILSSSFGYWLSQGKRDFRSVSQTIATKYEVLAEHKVAGQARELVGKMPGARAAQFRPAAGPGAPAAYPPPAYPPQGYPQGWGQPYPPVFPQQSGYGEPYPQQPYPPQPYPPQPGNGEPHPAPEYPASPSGSADQTPEPAAGPPKPEGDKE